MRRFTLLIAIALIATAAMAQNALMEGENSSKGFAVKQTQSKAKGEVYWSEDFDGDRWMVTTMEDGEGYLLDQDVVLPEAQVGGGQWTIVAQGEATTNRDAMYFHWSNVGPRGRWTSGDADDLMTSFETADQHIESMPEGTSVENGFMLLEGDYANTTESGQMPSGDLVFDMDAYVQCGPIDLSAAPGALFNIKTFYRYCCAADANLALEVSVDYDTENPDAATWGSFTLNNVTGGNDFTFQNQVHFNASERDMSINISRMLIGEEYISVAGSNNVYIRLHQTLSSHYFWMLDDVSITEPPFNDMVLTDGFADYMYDAEIDKNDETTAANNFYGGYTVIPEAVAGPFVKFRAAVVNNGQENIAGAKATVSITKDGEEVYSAEGTDGINIDTYVFDTVRVETNYTPSAAGTYQAVVSTSIDGEDGNTDNNQWKYDFKVGGDNWSTVYRGGEASFSSAGPRDWASGGYDGDACVNEFIIPESAGETKIYGLNFFFHSHRGRTAELQAIEDGYFGVYGRVWTYDADLEETVQTTIETSFKLMSIDDTATWVSLAFIDDGSLFLESDKSYYVGIECFTGTTQELRFMIGKDMVGPKQPVEGGFVYLSNEDSWARTGDNYAIELVLGDAPAVTKKITFNYDTNCDTTLGGLFDPEMDTIFVTGDYVGWTEPGTKESVRLYETGTPGVYTGSAFTVGVNADYEYKYFVGSSWEKGLSDSNLSLTMGDDDLIVDDSFCSVTSINDAAQLSAVEMYPNPFSNSLTITNAENVTTVTISNVVGQMVKEINVDQAEVEVSTADLEAGIYVISVTDANNNVKSQRVVKQ